MSCQHLDHSPLAREISAVVQLVLLSVSLAFRPLPSVEPPLLSNSALRQFGLSHCCSIRRSTSELLLSIVGTLLDSAPSPVAEDPFRASRALLLQHWSPPN